MFKKLMKMKEDKKGFTLAELLIVVAIIGVLVAISVPIFTAQLHKATLATNQANARSAKAAIITAYLEDPTIVTGEYDTTKGTLTTAKTAVTLPTPSASTDPSTWKVGDKGDGDKLKNTSYTTIVMNLNTTAGSEGTVLGYGFK